MQASTVYKNADRPIVRFLNFTNTGDRPRSSDFLIQENGGRPVFIAMFLIQENSDQPTLERRCSYSRDIPVDVHVQTRAKKARGGINTNSEYFNHTTLQRTICPPQGYL